MVLIAVAIQKRRQRLRSIARGLLVSYLTFVFIFAAAEVYFRWVYAESDGLPTFASQNWLRRYWHTNLMGYRDRDWLPEEWESKQKILVIGDSFAAGWGIESTTDRFSDVLARHLGNSSAVINLGKEGASTVEETENLREYPLQNPDIVILQYYLNDIENAALSIGLDPGLNPTQNMPSWANESFVGNFIYWRLISRFKPEVQGTTTYWNWLYSMYDNATVWDIHHKQLDAFIDQVESRGAQLYIVIFPNMLDPVASIPYVDRVAQAFEARGYGDYVIKLFDQAAEMPLAQRIVSERDAHASAAFNQLVGDLIYEKISSSS